MRENTQTMLANLQKRMVYVEIKLSLIQIAHDLLADEMYTREEAVQALLKVTKTLELEEVELSHIWVHDSYLRHKK